MSLGTSTSDRERALVDDVGATYVGCPTCSSVRYLTLLNGQVVSSDNIGDVLAARHRSAAPIEVDHAAISHLLHDGFVPQPRTVYRDVFAISIGFSAKVDKGGISFHRDFPFRLARSKGDQSGGADELLKRLVPATAASSRTRSKSVLLLSAGLDSTSLAVAAKEAGCDDLLCVTYGEQQQHAEVDLAQAVCRRLGLRHEAHILDVGSRQLPRQLIDYASAAPEPCADPALIATVSLIQQFCDRNTVVLDGSGSDYYFWSPPRPLDLLKVRFGPGRLAAVRTIRRLLPFYTRHERLLSSPIEPYLLHGAWLRHCDTRHFYPESADTHRFWLNEFRAHGDIPNDEARFQARAMYVGPGAHMKKTRNAAHSIGAAARFPWSDSHVASYCFHLPEDQRFDRASGKSKVLVRKMLRETIDYNDELVGKRPFLFGKRCFLEANLQFCREEILGCRLWSRKIESTFHYLTQMLAHGRPTENALLSLLMVSLWHNHWFSERLAATLATVPLRQAS